LPVDDDQLVLDDVVLELLGVVVEVVDDGDLVVGEVGRGVVVVVEL